VIEQSTAVGANRCTAEQGQAEITAKLWYGNTEKYTLQECQLGQEGSKNLFQVKLDLIQPAVGRTSHSVLLSNAG
jgi:hypothetical protein